ncbi:flagellar export chaperone FliS [Fusibacter tunisiensis]|uniref:Flagellar protein FliS n=1 Tax=Fusibacter tunisiensis TaxID=1008308 RepID=A0ABS2MPL4_9FIRM|nr:flagellar export chaperone FliS [Fusibacter tunisiensis]MBM7561334.1 flagellar protein FliS [Fusibacter tunisiensis]
MAIMNPYNYSKPRNHLNMAKPVNAVPSGNGGPKPNGNPSMDQYLENKIISAKPEELTYMLYEGLVKFIKKAKMNLETKKYDQVNANTQRAQAIVDELRSTLNMEIPMAESMDALYEYLGYKLLNANIDKDEALFDEAIEIAEDFKETWRKAFDLK